MLQTSNNVNCLYMFDITGNPIVLSTSFNTTSYALQFDPYGSATQTSVGSNGGTTQNPYSFHAGLQDRSTGYIKFGARWYDPATGTWTQQDTYNAPLSPGNANRYLYAAGDPINDGDPTGQGWLSWVAVGLGVVAVAATIATAGLAAPSLAADVSLAVAVDAGTVATGIDTGCQLTDGSSSC